MNKFLAECGLASRRKSEELIKEGRVSVNDKIILDFNFKVDDRDVVALDGERIKSKKKIYLILNKPKGVITSISDDRNRKTVIDLINVNQKIFPIGRLDYNTTGLLFLTNDGDFSQLLAHPRSKAQREYEVRLNRDLKIEDKTKLLTGIFLDGKKGKFITIDFLSQKHKKMFKVRCEEGRNRFVKRMFSHLGYQVEGLNRVSYAGIKLDVPIGKYRKLTQNEIQTIKEKFSN
ncbi:MAG: rRNA pseudouridine synthase [Ignavibacteria bacterium]|nr:rRNA pseudouridine synthase [Ignavibacteria bacterium]MBT8381797.1 rRNA pseudouridine synthase [Ignavibacteria bacterium]MBT8392611.1 rRNA pseudouridine synthase [Ignavibacteria bacterium]NNJ51630.1 rRNA pseudouridine synthase [Ignavibacteriaceae bacterium]NNL20304.1 rRNA pseudouridine synthase [Ignavibacteriaceae bacterium]